MKTFLSAVEGLRRLVLRDGSQLPRRGHTPDNSPSASPGELSTGRDRFLDEPPAKLQGSDGVAATSEATFSQLGESERRLLGVLAWLAPEPIPVSMFESERLAKDIPGPRDVLSSLAGHSLVRFVEGDSVEVHRPVQEATRGRVAEPERGRALRLALETVDALVPDDPGDARTWPAWTPLSPHVAAVTSFADASGISSPTARLMNDLGVHLRARGQFAAAEPLLRRALAIAERSLGPDDLRVAVASDNLAQLLHATNRLSEAEPLFRRALAIDERSLGAEHANVAIRLNNLALLLQDTSRVSEAEPLFRRALAIVERSFGPDHREVAIALDNLASLLQATGRLSDAEPLFRRALAIDERSFGPDHTAVAVALNNLGLLLQETGRPSEAEPLYRRSLAIVERSLGADHPEVAIRLSNLALLLQATNRQSEAEPLFRRALDMGERSLGPDHPDVAIRLNNLATLLQATNRLSEAEPLLQRAVAILIQFQRNTGHEHPGFETASANYRWVLRALGRTEEQA